MNVTLSQRIRELRLARGLTMEALAKEVGVNRSAVAHWEAGKNSPRERLLKRLAAALGVTVGDLYSEQAA